jgi:hypothetical protein
MMRCIGRMGVFASTNEISSLNPVSKTLENDVFSMAYCLVARTRNTRFLRLV